MSALYWYDDCPTIMSTTDDLTGASLTTYINAPDLVPEEAAAYLDSEGAISVPTVETAKGPVTPQPEDWAFMRAEYEALHVVELRAV